MGLKDADLVRRMQDGDREALTAFYARYLPMVWRFVHARLGNDTAGFHCEDVVSETFLAAIDGIAALDLAKGSAAAWLSGIARHKVADAFRRCRPNGEVPEVEADKSLEPPARMEEAELRAAVAAVMAAMDDEHRMALEWKYIDGLSVREMARRLGRTEKAIEALLYRARDDFRVRHEARQETPRRT